MHRFLGKYKNTETRPVFRAVSTHASRESLDLAEKSLIEHYWAQGMCDLNILPGGAIDTAGIEEIRKKRSESQAGEKSKSAKLTREQVEEARQRYLAGETPAQMAPDYPVGKQNLVEVLRNRTWVDESYDPPPPQKGKRRAMGDADIQELRRRAQVERRSCQAWADEFGVTIDAVMRVLKNKTAKDPNFNPDNVLGFYESGVGSLNWEKVNEIRTLRTQVFVPASKIGEKYGVTRSAVTALLRNQTWVDEGFNPEEVVPYG